MLSITPELLVEDIVHTLQWYQNTLGFKVIFTSPANTTPSFARIKNGQSEIMLFRRAEFADEIPSFSSAKMGGSFVLYLEVEDISKEWENVKDKVTIVQPLHTTDYGSQEFTIQDCNGYHLMFGQRN